MLDLLKQELSNMGTFSGDIPPILDRVIKAIPIRTIPYRMKLTIAVSELMLFTSHFRRNITHWNGSSIPANMIAFSLARSGDGKDSAAKAARKCFATGYERIQEKRSTLAHQQAQAAAAADGVEDPNDWNTYKEYYKEPDDLFAAPDSTIKGLMGHFNNMEEAGIGAGYIYSGEVGSELQSNRNMTDLIRFLAEVYDEGSKEVKLIGDKAEQMKSLTNFPVSALLMGSQDNILDDITIKDKFKQEFNTKLARRSFFNYNKEEVKQPTYSTIDEMDEAEFRYEEDAKQARHFVDTESAEIASTQLTKVGVPITVDDEVRKLFNRYRRYNSEIADSINAQYPLSKLVRRHLQWKAFKLSGALATYAGRDSILVEDFIQAISFVELLDKDMMLFEQELIKEPYELFSSFMHHICEDGKAFASLHVLKKMGYIVGSGAIAPKLKELISLVSSYDESGIYTQSDSGIFFEKIILKDAAGISYLPVDNSQVAAAVASGDPDAVQEAKINVARHAHEGYEYAEYTFEALAGMLASDWAYSPFHYRDGIHKKENIISGCKWICLDIDHGTVTDEEAHYILQGFNHHIARTSDPNNAYKYRILLELESEVDIDDRLWKHFTNSIATFLGFTIDPLPKSQIFFSYSGRNVLSTTDAKPLEVRDHLLYAHGQLKPETEVSNLSSAQKKALLSDCMDTFHYAFDAPSGEGSVSLIRAAKHALDLGMPKEDIIKLMHEINSYWTIPMESTRFQTTIINQVEGW